MIYDVPFIGRFIHFFRDHTNKTEAALKEAERFPRKREICTRKEPRQAALSIQGL
jgi:hypothetical protein